jgi:Rrf2 family protein
VRISKKTDYALRALFTLVDRWEEGEPISLAELARLNDVPKKFLEHIMLDLKEHGWVRSLPGRKGGYLLSVSPDRITLGQVIRTFDGVLAPIGCVSVTRNESCSQSPTCRFRRVFLDVRNLVARVMDNTTIATVASYAPVTNPEVFQLELTGGEGI